MTPRHDLARVTFRAEQDIDRLHAPLVDQIGASVRKHAEDTEEGPRITQDARRAILRDVDKLLDSVYPTKRGAPSRLQAMIESRARQAMLMPVADAVAVMRRHVPDGLRKRMGDTE